MAPMLLSSLQKIQALKYTNIIAKASAVMIMTYLTEVFKLDLTYAAAIVNIFWGLNDIMPLAMLFTADLFVGHKWMLCFSCFTLSAGFGLLAISTPPVMSKITKTRCSQYGPECIGEVEKKVFYTALAVLVLGRSSYLASNAIFKTKQEVKDENDQMENQSQSSEYKSRIMNNIRKTLNKMNKVYIIFSSLTLPLLFSYLSGYVTIPYIKSWSLRFGTPAICMVVGAFIFFTGWPSYTNVKEKDNLLITMCRVLVASALKIHYKLPDDPTKLHEYTRKENKCFNAIINYILGDLKENNDDDDDDEVKKSEHDQLGTILQKLKSIDNKTLDDIPSLPTRKLDENNEDTCLLQIKDMDETCLLNILHKLPHSNRLRWLDKAAITLTPQSSSFSDAPEQKQYNKTNRWKLCTVTEVEQTKRLVSMIPVFMTLLLVGIVSSIGNTYFIEQANHMNPYVGRLKFPVLFLLVFYELGRWDARVSQKYMIGPIMHLCLPPVLSNLLITVISSGGAVGCCIVAALVEKKRLKVVRKHGLLDKPSARIPMSMFYMVPPFYLLGGLDSASYMSLGSFVTCQHVRDSTAWHVMLLIVRAVFGMGKISSVLSVFLVEKIRPSWFQGTLNRSRLDKYYWLLAVLSECSYIISYFVLYWYPYKHDLRWKHKDVPEIEKPDI